MTHHRIQNLNGFSIGFFCSHSAHNVTHGRIQNLNGFSLGIFCSYSAHVTHGRIQNLNGFSLRFFCSYSAHNVTHGHIQRLPTSAGLAQARPNNSEDSIRVRKLTRGFWQDRAVIHDKKVVLDVSCWREIRELP